METFIRQVELDAVEMDGSWVILHPADYTVTKLNNVGGVCWNLLSKRQSIESLTDEIQRYYDASSDLVQEDVKTFLNQMMDVGLVRR